jgi:predicted methyltransferase
MIRQWTCAIVFLASSASLAAQDPPRNVWQEKYKSQSAEALAKQFEQPSRPVYRYRVAIVGLMELKPGMTAAEIGAGSGFLARMMAEQVAPGGRVIATELEDKMVDYMNARARQEGLTNFIAQRAQIAATGLEPSSLDVAAMVNVYSFLDKPAEVLQSIAQAMKPGGLLLVVDYPQAGEGADKSGAEAEDVIAAAAAAGFTAIGESGIVPGHYAIRFRRK